MKEYIFGYGSLIERQSRLRTTPDAETVYPIVVKGFQRGWFARTGAAGLSTTFLGCVKDSVSKTNGIIYEVNPDELEWLDQREKGYQRIKIDSEHIAHLTDQVPDEYNIWIYANRFSGSEIPEANLPCKEFPIVQSYVDMCINGCLEIESLYPIAKEKKFTVEFIKSTCYWSSYWVNDRIYPRRPFIYRPNAYQIDQLLKDNLPDNTIFNNIYFE